MDNDSPYSDCFYNFEREIDEEECIKFVTSLLDVEPDRVRRLYREIRGDETFHDIIESGLAETSVRPDELGPNWRDVLYVLVRFQAPDTVVETGVFDGLSSAYLLRALDVNGGGTLHSIDIKDPEILPSDIEDPTPGWTVPDDLQSYWDLRIGDAREILPEIAAETTIDLFLHDSNHDADHMAFEFDAAAKGMEANAILLADNVEYNDAFANFAEDNLRNVSKLTNAKKSLQRDGGIVQNDKLGAGLIR
ncbi:class I SAM-dependent methyltransferase [Haloterrigena salinisoli]|uniref:O-methyltransferase n=1 Tax=Haloterrigena salinisoli TaxID=3132747 RepID=UPI0030D21BD6